MSEIEAAWRGSRSSCEARQATTPDSTHGYAAVLATPWSGVMLGVSIHDEAVTSIDFLAGNAAPYAARNGAVREAVRQLRSYFRDSRHCFTLPLEPVGTPFQHKVWNAMRRVPAGETRSYGELARQLGSSPRAIGGACRVNPIPLIIPCHRIVAAQSLGGFMGMTAGQGIQLKQLLLSHESLP